MNSFLHADVFIHKKNENIREYANDSKEVYTPWVAQPSPVNQESLLREGVGFIPLGFTHNRQDGENAGRAKPRPNQLGSVN